ARAESLELSDTYNPAKTDSISAFSKGEIILPLSGIIDLEKERLRLSKDRDNILQEMEKINSKISNPSFLEKAKPEVIDKEKQKLKILEDKLEITNKGFEKLEL
ncbi:MAG: valine--tRNA ligase, partial [Leptospira sp.]|nr:valine--tRNA ligase [Leptospira sp.]